MSRASLWLATWMLISVGACDCGKGDPTPPGDPCDEDADCDDPVSPWCVMMRCVQCRDDGDCASGQSCDDMNACTGGVVDSSVDTNVDSAIDGDLGCVGAPPACCDPVAGTIDAACVDDTYECPAGSTLGACGSDAGVDGGACMLLDNGATCETDEQCCSNMCVDMDGARFCACVPEDGTCGRDADCCAGSCTDGACAVSGEMCSSAGTTCQDNLNACCEAMSLECAAAECREAGSCSEELSSCTSDAECCSASCELTDPMVPDGPRECTCHGLAIPSPTPTPVTWMMSFGPLPTLGAPTGTIREGLYTVSEREVWGTLSGPPGPAALRITQVDHVSGTPTSNSFILQLVEEFPPPVPVPPFTSTLYSETVLLVALPDSVMMQSRCSSAAPAGTVLPMSGSATFTATTDQLVVSWRYAPFDVYARVTFDYVGP